MATRLTKMSISEISLVTAPASPEADVILHKRKPVLFADVYKDFEEDKHPRDKDGQFAPKDAPRTAAPGAATAGLIGGALAGRSVGRAAARMVINRAVRNAMRGEGGKLAVNAARRLATARARHLPLGAAVVGAAAGTLIASHFGSLKYDSKGNITKYSADQSRDDHGRWTSEAVGTAIRSLKNDVLAARRAFSGPLVEGARTLATHVTNAAQYAYNQGKAHLTSASVDEMKPVAGGGLHFGISHTGAGGTKYNSTVQVRPDAMGLDAGHPLRTVVDRLEGALRAVGVGETTATDPAIKLGQSAAAVAAANAANSSNNNTRGSWSGGPLMGSTPTSQGGTLPAGASRQDMGAGAYINQQAASLAEARAAGVTNPMTAPRATNIDGQDIPTPFNSPNVNWKNSGGNPYYTPDGVFIPGGSWKTQQAVENWHADPSNTASWPSESSASVAHGREYSYDTSVVDSSGKPILAYIPPMDTGAQTAMQRKIDNEMLRLSTKK